MRIKLEIPDQFDFTCDITLRVTDMNYGNHLGNDRILVLAQECRVLFLKSLDCTEFDLFGGSIIQADAAIVYKSEGHAGDIIRCNLKVMNVLRSSFDLLYQFENLTTHRTLAECKTGMVCYDYTAKKVIGVPEKFTHLFQ
jgi:acyl-CoA thioesterase FadM